VLVYIKLYNILFNSFFPTNENENEMLH